MKWALSKLLPQRFADRTVIAGDADAPLIPAEMIDPRRLADELHRLAEAAKAPPVIEHEPGEVSPAPLPAPEPRRVFDVASGQVRATLLSGECEDPDDDLRRHAMRAADRADKITRLPTFYRRTDR